MGTNRCSILTCVGPRDKFIVGPFAPPPLLALPGRAVTGSVFNAVALTRLFCVALMPVRAHHSVPAVEVNGQSAQGPPIEPVCLRPWVVEFVLLVF